MKSSSKQILTYTSILLIGVFLFCCQGTAKESSEDTPDEPHEEVIDDEQDNPVAYTSVDSVQILAAINRKELPFNGRFFSSLSWNDRLGGNILIISEKGEYDEGNGRKEIFAYHYVKRGTLYEVLWQMNDFVDGWGCDLDIQLIHFFPLISDVDSNGIAETALFYALNDRCDASTFPAKLMVHEGADKFAIRGVRGQYLGPPEEVVNEYRAEGGLPPLKYKDLDTANSTVDAAIVNFYSHQWDQFISLENTLKGALPDSLITTIK